MLFRSVQALRRHDWVVYAKTPLGGPTAVLDYLARYTHRTAIGNERLVALTDDEMLLRVRADDTGGKRTIRMPGQQFIGRLAARVALGLQAYAPLRAAGTGRQDLAMPAANPQAREDAQAFMRRVATLEIECCAHCKLGRWRVMQELAADRVALAAIVPASCRGPP